jgi:hypothetical protein
LRHRAHLLGCLRALDPARARRGGADGRLQPSADADQVFIPVALSGIIAATIFAFTVSWAQFLYPLAFLYSDDQMTLTVGTVTTLIRGDVFAWAA